MSLTRGLLWIAGRYDHHFTGEVATRSGNHHATLAPYGLFRGNGGESIVLGILSTKLWREFCLVMNRPELADDPRFATNDRRVQRRLELIGIIEDWLKTFPRVSQALALLNDAGIPCSKVYSQLDIDTDPHYNQSAWIVEMPVPDSIAAIRSRRFSSNPFDFSAFEAEYPPGPQDPGRAQSRGDWAAGLHSGGN